MTERTNRELWNEIESELETMRDRRGSEAERIHVIGRGGHYSSAEEYEARHGHPPEGSPGLVIHVPEASEEY